MITAYPDLKEYDINSGWDFIVMGCDGIWEVKTNRDICLMVKNKLASN